MGLKLVQGGRRRRRKKYTSLPLLFIFPFPHPSSRLTWLGTDVSLSELEVEGDVCSVLFWGWMG
jgi:hypothetical protein